MDILTRNITVALILTATSPGRAYTNTARLSQEIPVLTWTYTVRDYWFVYNRVPLKQSGEHTDPSFDCILTFL